MKLAAIELVGMFLAFFILAAVFVIPVVLMILCIRALWLYIKTHARAQEVKKETAAVRKTLSETLKDHRTRCKMTQEFVAESLGVSRQAVSKVGDRRDRPHHVQPRPAGPALRRHPGRTAGKRDLKTIKARTLDSPGLYYASPAPDGSPLSLAA